MSLTEKLYLGLVLAMFGAFIVLLATLSWLDAKDDRIRRVRAKQAAFSKAGAIPEGASAHR